MQKKIDKIPPIVEKGLLKGIQVSKRDFSKGFQVRKSKGGNKVRFSVISQKSTEESGGGVFSSVTFR